MTCKALCYTFNLLQCVLPQPLNETWCLYKTGHNSKAVQYIAIKFSSLWSTDVLIRQHHTKTANMYSDKYKETLQTKVIFQARSSQRQERTWFKNIHISKIFPSYLYNCSDCSTVKWYCDNIKYHGNYALMIYIMTLSSPIPTQT